MHVLTLLVPPEVEQQPMITIDSYSLTYQPKMYLTTFECHACHCEFVLWHKALKSSPGGYQLVVHLQFNSEAGNLVGREDQGFIMKRQVERLHSARLLCSPRQEWQSNATGECV